MCQSRATSQSLGAKVVGLLIAIAYFSPVPAPAQQGGNTDLSRLVSSFLGRSLIAGGGGGFANGTIAHNGRNWNLIVTASRAADSTAPMAITLNGDTIQLDSTGAKMIAPAGGPSVTFRVKKDSLSVRYEDNKNNSYQWSASINSDMNLIAITLTPESELVTQAGQLQEHLGRIQDKLRAHSVVTPSDSAQVATGFRVHTKLSEVKEILKQISADLDASK